VLPDFLLTALIIASFGARPTAVKKQIAARVPGHLDWMPLVPIMGGQVYGGGLTIDRNRTLGRHQQHGHY
jgi:hypothetical protein